MNENFKKILHNLVLQEIYKTLLIWEIIQNLTSEIVENPEHYVWCGVQSPAHKVRLAQRNKGGVNT